VRANPFPKKEMEETGFILPKKLLQCNTKMRNFSHQEFVAAEGPVQRLQQSASGFGIG
jgi:hypothetical protein